MENTREIIVNFRFSSRKFVLFLAVFFIAWHPGFLGSESLTLTTYYPAPYGGYVGLLTTGGTAAAPVNTVLARNNAVGAGNVLMGTQTQIVVPPTPGGDTLPKLEVNGKVRSSGEMIGILSGFGQFRAIAGNYGAFIRNDGSDTYMPLVTDSGNQYGVWNGLRPLRINNGSGDVWAANSQVQMRHSDGAVIMTGGGGLNMNGTGGINMNSSGGIAFNGTGGITGLCRAVQYWVNGGGSCVGSERVITWYGDNANSRCGMLFRGGAVEAAGNWTPYSCVGADYSGWLLCCKMS